MFENPIHKQNPMWKPVKELGKFQKMDLIPKADIEATLQEIEIKSANMLAGTYMVHFVDKERIRQFYQKMTDLAIGVRADLADPKQYTEKDGYYIKVPG